MPRTALGADGADQGLQHCADQGPPGKLTWAGRAWATGKLCPSVPSAEIEEAAFWGIDPSQLRGVDTEPEGIWNSNMAAVHAFLCIDTQFRVTGRGHGPALVTGLDYQGAQAGLALAGIEVTPDLWGDLRLIEAGAVAALNRGPVQ